MKKIQYICPSLVIDYKHVLCVSCQLNCFVVIMAWSHGETWSAMECHGGSWYHVDCVKNVVTMIVTCLHQVGVAWIPEEGRKDKGGTDAGMLQ